MPVKIKKVGNKFQVSTPNGVKAKSTTKQKAKAQERMLNAVDHGFKPTKGKDINQKRKGKKPKGGKGGGCGCK